jgi:hypothetical protein
MELVETGTVLLKSLPLRSSSSFNQGSSVIEAPKEADCES